MIKAKKNLNGLLEPLAYGRNDEVIKELIENNPLLKQSSLIEKNSALINRRVPLSAKTVVLGSLSKGLKKNESGLLKYKGNI